MPKTTQGVSSSAVTTSTPELAGKIAARTARVAVIGLGYVGLPVALSFARAGFPVRGIDEDAARVRQLKAGRDYKMRQDEALSTLAETGSLSFTEHFDDVGECDVVIICVPTPEELMHALEIQVRLNRVAGNSPEDSLEKAYATLKKARARDLTGPLHAEYQRHQRYALAGSAILRGKGEAVPTG